MAHVMWTYLGNYTESARYVEEFNDPRMDAMKAIERLWDFYSDDFWRKATFHVFYEDGSYEKIYASEIREIPVT